MNDLMAWIGATPITYTLNVDFVPTPMDAPTLTALFAIHQGGGMSFETFFATLKAGEIVPDSLTFEEERKRIDHDNIDRPPVTAPATAFNNNIDTGDA